MKLLTHNFMRCQAKDCASVDLTAEGEEKPYPLKIVVETSEEEKIDEDHYSLEARTKMIENLEYPALIKSLSDIEFKPDFENDPFTEEEKDLPETLPEDWQKDTDLVNKIFNTSMVKEIITGQLICRRCSREFRIVNGIINMLLKEDEIEHEE